MLFAFHSANAPVSLGIPDATDCVFVYFVFVLYLLVVRHLQPNTSLRLAVYEYTLPLEGWEAEFGNYHMTPPFEHDPNCWVDSLVATSKCHNLILYPL